MISRKKGLILAGIIGILLILGSFLTYYAPSIVGYAQAMRTIYTLNTLEGIEYRNFFAAHTGEINQIRSVNEMVDMIIDAFETDRIGMFECHSLAHDIGHYGGYSDNFSYVEEYLSKKNLDFCGSGFMHGVEGQLANNPYPQNAESLYEFCKLAMPLEPFYAGCYHGAGHAFMENTDDVTSALRECDTLITDPNLVPNVSNCYRGVFSENVNYLMADGKSSADLLQFCMDLSEEFHDECAEELNGFNLTPESSGAEIEKAMRMCGEGNYSYVLTKGCMQSLGGVITDLLLTQNQEIIMPTWALSFSVVAQMGFIDGTVGALRKNKTEKSRVGLQSFCASLDTLKKEYCLAQPR
jgi:hypothetical protein